MSVWINPGWFNLHPDDRDRVIALLKEHATEARVRSLYSKALELKQGDETSIRLGTEFLIVAEKGIPDFVRLEILWDCPYHKQPGAGLEEIGRVFDLWDDFDILELPNSMTNIFVPTDF